MNIRARVAALEKRAPKYRNRKTVVDGITFASAKEAKRYGELKLLERAGKIGGLVLQPVFVLAPSVIINGRKKPPLRYKADFAYREVESDGLMDADKPQIIEDCKGDKTQAYIIRRHLLKAVHNIDILET